MKTKEWRKDGLLHREDGPAVIYPNGDEEWWIDGKHHRLDGPALISTYCKIWMKEGLYHREDGPAVEYDNGIKRWYIKGKLHRLDGPAVVRPNIFPSGFWYYEGKRIEVSSQEEFEQFLRFKPFW